MLEQTGSQSQAAILLKLLVLSHQKVWQTWISQVRKERHFSVSQLLLGRAEESQLCNWWASTASAAILYPFLSLKLYCDSWDEEAALCTQACVISVLCLSLTNTIAGLKGHLNHPLTSVSFWRQVGSKRENNSLKRHAAQYTSLLLISECSGVSVAPLHPGAQLSNKHQWMPCQNPVWAAALTGEDSESHRREKHHHWTCLSL